MKIKKFRAYRPEIQVEFKKPILGRLYLLANWPKFVKLESCQLQIAMTDDTKQLKKIYILIWPKFEFSAAGKEQ